MHQLNTFLATAFDLLYLSFSVLFTLAAATLILWLITRFLTTLRLHRRLSQGQALLIRVPHYKNLTPDPQREDDYSQAFEQLLAELYGQNKSFFKSLLSPLPSFNFEIWADHNHISFYAHSPAGFTSTFANIINSYYPEADITLTPSPLSAITSSHAHQTSVKLSGPLYSPIRTYEALTGDSLNTLITKLTRLHPQEHLIIQFSLQPAGSKWRNQALKKLSVTTTETSASSSSSSTDTPRQTTTSQKKDINLEQSLQDKTSRPAFTTFIKLTSFSFDKQRSLDNLQNTTSSFSQFNLPPLSRFSAPSPRHFSAPSPARLLSRTSHLPFLPLPPRRSYSILNTKELATIFHFPSQFIDSPKINWLPAKKAPAPPNMPQEGTIIGKNVYRGQTLINRLSTQDRRRHMYILGQTGTGKTEFGKYLFLQDVYAGHGVCYIDPHGDAAQDLLSKIPRHRLKDVVYFDPTNTAHPPGFNILQSRTSEEKQIIVNSFIALLYKLYDPNRTGMVGPMLERAVRNVMLTAMEEEGNTLIEVLRLLTSPDFAATKIDLITDPLVKTYWTEELARTSDFHKSETLGYFSSKFDHFVTDPTIRNIIGQSESSFNLAQIMNDQKILIVNLAKGVIGTENASFLGLLMIPHILIAAMSRANIPEDQRTDFYLYVDEFQNFATPDFVQILSESRKFKLNLTMINQYLDQVPEDIIEAVFGNVGTTIAFRVGIEDAEKLEPKFAPVFNRYDLSNNTIGNFAIKTLIDGSPTSPFSSTLTLDDINAVPGSDLTRDLLKNISTLLYTLPVDLVKLQIKARSGLLT